MKNVWGPFQEGLVVMAIFDPYISPLDEKLSMHFFFKIQIFNEKCFGAHFKRAWLSWPSPLDEKLYKNITYNSDFQCKMFGFFL